MMTLTLDGRPFPVVGLICPPIDGVDETDWERGLGLPVESGDFHLPAENGVLFNVNRQANGKWSLRMYSRTCYLEHTHPEDPLWMPIPVMLLDGKLVAEPRRTREFLALIRKGARFLWTDCEEDWIVETIDRLGRKPFTAPEGLPQVRLIDPHEPLEKPDYATR